MRIIQSENSVLGCYVRTNDQHHRSFDDNVPVIPFPDFASIQLQLNFGTTDFTLLGITLRSDGDVAHPPTSTNNFKRTADVNNDGVDEYFFELNGVTYDTEPTEGRYYLELLFDTFEIYTDYFYICSPSHVIEFWDNCDSKNFGYFSEGFRKKVYLKEFYIEKSNKEEDITTRSNGFNVERPIFSNITNNYTARVYGAQYLAHIIPNISNYDNVVLKQISPAHEWEIENMSIDADIIGQSDSMGLVYSTKVKTKLDCAINLYENAPFTDAEEVNPGDLTCGAFAVTIGVSGDTLSYSLSNDPDGTVVEDVSWYKNGEYVGDGSTITRSGFATYSIRIQKKNCIVTDTHVYANPCVMSSNFTVNSDVINGSTTNPPGAVAYEVFDPSGASVSNALPYTAVTSGTFTIVVSSGNCQNIYNVPVQLNVPSDCSFTFEVTKDANHLLSIANNTASSYSVEWFKVLSSNVEESVGTGDTYQITEEGLYIARMSSLACEKDVLFVYLDPTKSTVQGGYSDYEEFVQTGANMDVTGFTLPHPLINTESEINQQLQIYVNGVLYHYRDTTSNNDEFTIDFANNRIVFHFSGFTNVDVKAFRKYV